MTLAVPNGELNISFSVMDAPYSKRCLCGCGSWTHHSYKLLGPSKVLEQSLLEGRVTAQSIITLSAYGQTITEDHTDARPSRNHVHIAYDRER